MTTESSWKPWQRQAIWFLFGLGCGLLVAVLMAAQNLAKITKVADAQAKNLSQQTLLFDPPANSGLANAGTPMTEVYNGNRATPLIGYPRWIIVGKVKPTIAGNPAGAKYSCYDPQTNQYDGPYVPESPTVRP